ncbi:MAG: hypothetical protein NT154_33115 [Verrucomicrobia bacterium]|nr:hypothetical protein [Verrucomicrobiota bacterium]
MLLAYKVRNVITAMAVGRRCFTVVAYLTGMGTAKMHLEKKQADAQA